MKFLLEKSKISALIIQVAVLILMILLWPLFKVQDQDGAVLLRFGLFIYVILFIMAIVSLRASRTKYGYIFLILVISLLSGWIILSNRFGIIDRYSVLWLFLSFLIFIVILLIKVVIKAKTDYDNTPGSWNHYLKEADAEGW